MEHDTIVFHLNLQIMRQKSACPRNAIIVYR